jgi:hypothetical protein
MTRTTEQKKYYRLSELKQFGWTDGLIKNYLGEADRTTKNPVYSSKARMKLYLIERVNAIVTNHSLTPILEATLATRNKRSLSAIRASQVKSENLLNEIKNITIIIPKYDYAELVDLACEDYNSLQWQRSRSNWAATSNSETDFLYRIIHNYLRHEESSYEDLIDQLFGKVGKEEAYEILRRKVTEEIDRVYPDLLDYLNARNRQIHIKASDTNSCTSLAV